MIKTQALDVVDAFFTALTERDYPTMRSLIHEDLAFTGPLATIDNAEDYLQGMQHVRGATTDLFRRAIFTDGDDVCQIYDVTFANPELTLPVAEWHHVRENRIDRIQVFCDTRPLLAQMPPDAA